MGMRGNYIGNSKVSDAYIATHVPSSAGTMMRVVPDTMTMQMHMFSAMYGVTDLLSVMAMASYVDKWMSMTTFKGMSGSTVLGSSAGSNDGLATCRSAQITSSTRTR